MSALRHHPSTATGTGSLYLEKIETMSVNHEHLCVELTISGTDGVVMVFMNADDAKELGKLLTAGAERVTIGWKGSK